MTTPNTMDRIYVGRQAIVDQNLSVYAYELLYRPGAESNGAFVEDGDQASSIVLLNTFIEMGLERIAGGRRVFVNMTKTFFTDMPPLPLGKDRLVMEILEDIEVDQDFILAIKTLKAAGHAIALDDYMFEAKWEPILPLVDIIKVDVLEAGWPLVKEKFPQLKAYGATLLAEKLETFADFEHAKDLGFDLFQGYFIAKPQIIEGTRLGENQVAIMQLLARLNDPSASIDDLKESIEKDPGFSFKILRFINSAAVGLPRKVDSIQQSVVYMGINHLRAWASLFAMARMDNKPLELINIGLVRANFCDLLCREVGKGTAETAYIVGLFSILDALMDTSMQDILKELPLTDETTSALVDQTGVYGQFLHCILNIEENNWDEGICGSDSQTLNTLYLNSTEAAFASLNSL